MYFGGGEKSKSTTEQSEPASKASVTSVAEPAETTQTQELMPRMVLPVAAATSDTNEVICSAMQSLSGKVTFKTNSAELTAEAQQELNRLAELLRDNPEVKVLIQAHTDADGNEAYNQMLSDNRARSVQEYLGTSGINVERMQASGFGESRPIADNNSREGKAKNRRVEFIPAGISCSR
jgi:outer membrane protein OmpA-like peptidoglycan-associated protein